MLTRVPLRLGPLGLPGYSVRRSGIRWLCEDGHLCRAGETVAFCNIGLAAESATGWADPPFPDEYRDLQVALAPRIAGRIRQSATSSYGGFLDWVEDFQVWSPDFVIGHLERAEGAGAGLPGDEDELEILIEASRQRFALSGDRRTLMGGWHDRGRAWRARDGEGLGSVLSMGICELADVLRGESWAFLELFEAIGGPAHAIYFEDLPIVPCAPVIHAQTIRAEADHQAITEDIAAYFAKASPAASPTDWLFVAAMQIALRRAPLKDEYDVLSRTGLQRAGPADAVVLSLNAESQTILRHRRLGYPILIHGWLLARSGPTVRAWIKDSFEPVKRTIDDVARDYRALIDLTQASPGRLPAHLLIANGMSTTGDEDVQTYLGFDAPLGDTLLSVHRKDMNLMLHDLARERDVAIVDVDAIAADIGGQRNLPDGIHSSGALQVEVRGEILHILRARGVPGFGPA